MDNAIYIATTHNCAANLAGEAYLLGQEYDHILYLWVNDPCIVIGRFQNPFSECNLEAMEKDHVQLVRRQSGGGAVYHDQGNLCFTFVGKKDVSSKEENFKIVLDALRSLGIEGELSGRNDIVMQGKKISGNAFQTTKDKFCHHGTLLVNSDLSVMGNYLTPSSSKLASKAVKSVASRVGNLQQAKGDIEMKMVEDALIVAFCKAYGPTEIEEIDFLNFPESQRDFHLFGDKETILSKTPQFSHAISHRYSWGEATVHLDIIKGVIETARVYTDCLDTNLVPQIEKCLNSVPYRKEALQAVVDIEQDERVLELVSFLISQL
ncbi:lipoyltransferase and lipoate-protein ligase [Sphaerochaeta pleomorpha str. Grapes]|uniref:lipoate--protein ligase n=1 Tax=Sphaerochaeta pleomorpha (strain ATCC BAA-1885 / DSM 22778 / Grapes) TaxID=158190 RepID=G8QT89_SPHPG|nr:lipoate--protein ligase [Sphaerochaeta pleomorpha]AEV29056.1 lipoyltransferase and lipoate-protein ligase [Sphaerochaeta pleomorpha str. Grapes]